MVLSRKRQKRESEKKRAGIIRAGALKTPLPLFFVAIFFVVYLGYSLYMGYVDLTSPSEPLVRAKNEQKTTPSASLLIPLAHKETNNPEKCQDCHNPAHESWEQLHGEMSDSLGDLANLFTPADYMGTGMDIDIFSDPGDFRMKRAVGPQKPVTLVGNFKGVTACLECHPQEEFSPQHEGHPFEPQQNCLICHSTHNSDFKPLLIQPKQSLCLICHEP